MRTHTHTHTCAHARTHTHTHICAHARTHAHTHIHTRTHTHTHKAFQDLFFHEVLQHEMKTSLLLWQKDRLNIRNNAIRAMTVAVKAERSSCLKMYTFHTVNIVNTHSGVGSLLKTMPWGGEVEWGEEPYSNKSARCP